MQHVQLRVLMQINPYFVLFQRLTEFEGLTLFSIHASLIEPLPPSITVKLMKKCLLGSYFGSTFLMILWFRKNNYGWFKSDNLGTQRFFARNYNALNLTKFIGCG